MDRPISDIEYTGLTDTADGFSGSTTLDSAVDPGSPLPLVIGPRRNQGIDSPHNQFFTSTYDLWDTEDPSAALALSGVSDPPFQSEDLSTPYPAAVQPYGATFNAMSGQSKFGFGLGSLLGIHPRVIVASPSELHGAKVGAVVHDRTPSGHFTLAVVVVVITLGLLLLSGGGNEL